MQTTVQTTVQTSVQTSVQIGFQNEYANLSVCGEISCNMEFESKKKDETDQGTFREESFIQNSSWFLLEPKNVGISYVCETHEVEFIMLKSMFTWLHGKNIAQRFVENTESSTF